MLMGTYEHTVDSKGRVNFPAKLRNELGERFYLVRWYENAIAAFSEEGFRKMYEEDVQGGRRAAREEFLKLGSEGGIVEPDKQGRILIPSKLREKAGILGDVTIVGAIDWAEIWSTELWNERQRTTAENQVFTPNR